MGNDNFNNKDSFEEFEDISSGREKNQDDVNLYTGESQQEGISLSSFLENEPDKKSHKIKKTKLKKERKQSRGSAFFRGLVRVVLSLVLIGVIVCGVGIAGVVAWLSAEEAKGSFDMTEYDLNSTLEFTTTIYAKNSKGKYEVYDRLRGNYNRIWVAGEDISDNLENAFIAIEDKRFRTHAGVDWKRTVSAFINSFVNIYGGRQGGSTITQQLVKNITMDNDLSAMRKVREIMRARYLEDNYSKDSILEWYLNTIPMGTGIYGVEVAANYYFGKSADELTIAECASLASITNEPENYRPDLEANEEAHLERRDLILWEMLDQKFITEEQYEKAINSKLKVTADQSVLNIEDNNNSYFTDTLIEDVIDMLVEEKGYDPDSAAEEVYNGGYKIYSTIDLDVQKALDKVYQDESYFDAPVSTVDGETTPQSAMTVMDYEGHIVGIVGGKGEKKGARTINRAALPRQIGSCMKPIGVYSLAMEYNEITYSSMIDDYQMRWSDPSIEGGKWPNNYDFSYTGKCSVEYAIYHSVNCSPVHVLRNLIGNGEDNYSKPNNGIEISYDFLTTKLGFKHFGDDDKNFSSLCLGGCARGATSIEMAAAYSVFGNLGYYYQPKTYTIIYDQFDNVVHDATKDKPVAAISEDTATVMNHLLRQVVKKGTGNGAQIGDFEVYAKTGTTTDSQDLWFAGGTPHYVAACWYGFDEPAKYSPDGMYGAGVSASALNIWHDVMEEIHEDLPEKEFEDSEYAEKMKFCTKTGLIATSACKKTSTGWYRSDNIPDKCDCKKSKKDKKDKDEKDKDSKEETEEDVEDTEAEDVEEDASDTEDSTDEENSEEQDE